MTHSISNANKAPMKNTIIAQQNSFHQPITPIRNTKATDYDVDVDTIRSEATSIVNTGNSNDDLKMI